MTDILARLRVDAGQLTLATLIQERALAALEIERLRARVDELGGRSAALLGRQGRTSRQARSTPSVPIQTKGSNAEQTTRHLDRTALLRLKDVSQLFGMSRSTIYKRVSEKTFPAPMRISERSVRWRMADLEEWSSKLDRSS